MTQAFDLQFSHVGIYVTDLETMAAFYHRVMGFPITDRGPLHGAEMVFFSRDPREHHQLVLVAGRPPGLPDKVINQLSFRVESLGEVLRFYRRIRSAEGVSDIHPICHGHAWSVYFRDPEGNRVEVYTPTPWYVHQPIREEMDFDLPEAEVLRRTEAFCRTLPGFMPAEAWRRQTERAIAGHAPA
jgi:catechol 2,3-dioxygenase-like lactoylglutathione lyase family enzyme